MRVRSAVATKARRVLISLGFFFLTAHSLAASPLSLTPDWMDESNLAGAQFGYSVASAGDVNGDGYDDVVVGAFFYSNGETNEGKVYLYQGSASGLSLTPSWTMESDMDGAFFGLSVASAGDVNGDGYDDVIVGAPQFANGEDLEGGAFLYLGSAAGLSLTPSWIGESDQTGGFYGYSVASAGDVNGDGYDDVIVGATNYSNDDGAEGRAFLYLGSSAGLSPTASWAAESDQHLSFFGHAVASAGDVNGDGHDDVIVGAYGFDDPVVDEGRVFLYLGSTSGPSTVASWISGSGNAGTSFGYSVASAGDVDGDGYDDVVVGAYLDADIESNEGLVFLYRGSASGPTSTPSWITGSDQDFAWFGYSVASAGDVNGDGYSDVIVGSRLFTNGEQSEGRAFLYLGSAAGLASGYSWTAESDQAYADFGYSVASAGDVNGDGFADVVAGAPGYDNGQTTEGRAYVYMALAPPTPTPTWTPTFTSTPNTPIPTSTCTATPPIALCETLFISGNLFNVSEQRTVSIRLLLCEPGKAKLAVYNSAGEVVRLLKPWEFTYDTYIEAWWDGKNMSGEPVASGVYIVRFEGSRGADTRKLAVIR